MTSQHDQLSSRDYQKEAEHTRRRLAEHLDELSDRLTPGQVFDEMLTYSRAGGGTFLRAFSNAMRENPIPSLLIGAGCMMFISEKMGMGPGTWGNGGSSRRASRAADIGDGGYDPYYSSSASMPDTGARISHAAAGTAGAGSRMKDQAASTARSAAGAVQAGARRTAEMASRQAASAADTMSQAAGASADAMGRTAGAVGDSMRRTAGAVGDGVGQAAGVVSDTMSRTAGAVSDTMSRTADAVSDTMSRTAGAVGDTTNAAAGAMRQAVGAMSDTVAGA
ncbi:MAG: DUF3618 domain-containing protein, partial [Hyphomicrobiales bacterium]|nr:DUF3618 domain-containing protein [Hyphomicrobiales bacterium]